MFQGPNCNLHQQQAFFLVDKKEPIDILIQGYVGNDGSLKNVKVFFVREKYRPIMSPC
jgi:hypothetical protein